MDSTLRISVTIGHKAENVHGADLVVYTVAILPDNPERVEMERLGIPSIERATLLLRLEALTYLLDLLKTLKNKRRCVQA